MLFFGSDLFGLTVVQTLWANRQDKSKQIIGDLEVVCLPELSNTSASKHPYSGMSYYCCSELKTSSCCSVIQLGNGQDEKDSVFTLGITIQLNSTHL